MDLENHEHRIAALEKVSVGMFEMLKTFSYNFSSQLELIATSAKVQSSNTMQINRLWTCVELEGTAEERKQFLDALAQSEEQNKLMLEIIAKVRMSLPLLPPLPSGSPPAGN